MSDQEIHVVTGAFGYSGKYIARRLLDAGKVVRTLTNSPDRPDPFDGAVRAFPLAFDDPEQLVESLKGCKVLYNTYWVRFNHKTTFKHSIAVDNTQALFEAAKQAGVERVVHTSITNPSADSPLEYFDGQVHEFSLTQGLEVILGRLNGVLDWRMSFFGVVGMSRWYFVCACLSFLVLPSCSESLEGPHPSDTGPTSVGGPLLGTADGMDSADRTCQVVLREVGRRPNGTGGYLDDGHDWIWFGRIDVAVETIETGATAAVMYRAGDTGEWWEVDVRPDYPPTNGVQPFDFWIDEHVPGPGMSGTSISRSVIELVPYLSLPGGGRVFDHNRHPGDFDNYVLTIDNNWAVSDEASVCATTSANTGSGGDPDADDLLESFGIDARPEAALSFTEGWTTESWGVPTAGGTLTVQYDLSRLTTCRGTHNGFPAWDIRAFALFQPNQTLVDASVREFESDQGRPTTNAYPIDAVFEIPSGAESVELWFWNFAVTGGVMCQDWDSNTDQNYQFDVQATPGWVGNPTVVISRGAAHPCDGGVPLESGFEYDSWARSRAAHRSVCFEVWQQGVTDWQNPDLWKQLDVQVHYRFGEGEFTSDYVELFDFVGNNARYALNIGDLDPFRLYHCPDVPVNETTTASGERRVEATMAFLFTVNGVVLAPDSDLGMFTGLYWDHAPHSFRDENCGDE